MTGSTHSFLAIVAAAAGGAAVREAMSQYRDWKARRLSIEMVPDRNGMYVDRLKIFERRLFWAYLIGFPVAILVGVYAIDHIY